MAQILNVPYSRQETDTGCLLACAQMVLNYWGISRTQTELGRLLGWRSQLGVPGSNITRLKSVELDIVYEKGSLEHLATWLSRGVPVIALIQAAELSYWTEGLTQHAIVLVGIDEETVLALDPASTDHVIHLSVGEFALAWVAMDYRFAVIVRQSEQHRAK